MEAPQHHTDGLVAPQLNEFLKGTVLDGELFSGGGRLRLVEGLS